MLIDRYIGRVVAVGIISVLLVLLVLLGFIQLLEEIENVDQHYTLKKAFAYVGLVMPRYIYELFPITTLLGSLIGLGSLASNSELTAIRAAGVSINHIMLAILKIGFILLLSIILIGEFLAPLAEQKARQIKLQAVSDQATLKTRYGFWSRNGNSFINVGQILPNGRLMGVSIYDFDENQVLQRATHAVTATYEDDYWILEQVRQSVFLEQRITTSRLQSMEWPVLVEQSMLKVLSVNQDMLPAWDLWRYIQYLQENAQESSTFEVTFWRKIVSPLVTLVMLFLSIPFVFGSLRSVGIGQRVFVGAIIGIVFFILNMSLSRMAVVYGMNPMFAAIFPTLLFFSAAIWFLRRIH